jgi:hypothetical protein
MEKYDTKMLKEFDLRREADSQRNVREGIWSAVRHCRKESGNALEKSCHLHGIMEVELTEQVWSNPGRDWHVCEAEVLRMHEQGFWVELG